MHLIDKTLQPFFSSSSSSDPLVLDSPPSSNKTLTLCSLSLFPLPPPPPVSLLPDPVLL